MSVKWGCRVVCWAVCLVLVSWAERALADGRELHWREVSVEARLDSDGRLHVRERQAMVFTGDWNGGERTFRVTGEQELELDSLVRVDPDRGEVELRPGDLAQTDDYAWADSDERVLRWRSRQPSDPPFEGRELTYILSYRLENILVHQGGAAYLLDHDFAFTERDGEIERFTLQLELDPVWQAQGSAMERLQLGPLPPGQGAVLRLPLTYAGSGAPSAVLHAAPLPVRLVFVALLSAAAWLVLRRLLRRERALGRFAPLPQPSAIDDAWLAEHVLSLEPEVVGAAYDHKTGAAEVAAVLARMVIEKKLASRVTRVPGWLGSRDNLELSLLVPRRRLQGYERALVNGLFFDGDETSTDAIRAHYKKRGFDPAARLEKPLKQQTRARLGASGDAELEAAALAAGALSVASGLTAIFCRPSEIALVVVGLCGTALWTLLALILAYRWSLDMAASARGAVKFLLPLGLSLQSVLMQLVLLELSFWGSLALAAWGMLHLLVVALAARSSDGSEGIALRKRLTAARLHFARELTRDKPRLEDAWFPYLLALDLGSNVERWFRAFGGQSVGRVGGQPSFGASSAGVGSSAAGSWTGGGGAFGGAGATGTWIAATGAMAAGVARASSGSGGGSSGGSSGGGGGGGW